MILDLTRPDLRLEAPISPNQFSGASSHWLTASWDCTPWKRRVDPQNCRHRLFPNFEQQKSKQRCRFGWETVNVAMDNPFVGISHEKASIRGFPKPWYHSLKHVKLANRRSCPGGTSLTDFLIWLIDRLSSSL